jgi:hypothetical protein
MEQTFSVTALWFGLALIATFLASRLKISGALMEIVVGIGAAAVAVCLPGNQRLQASRSPSRFCLPIPRVRPAKNLPRRVTQITRSQAHV